MPANMPICNAREYFVLAFQKQMARVVEEWKYLVRWTELNVNAYVCGCSVSEGVRR
jgi:hypothetical protein